MGIAGDDLKRFEGAELRAWFLPACCGGGGARFHGPRPGRVAGRFLLPYGFPSWRRVMRSRVRFNTKQRSEPPSH